MYQIFNNEVDAYQSWALFLIFCSILILVSGVVLLTNKKPDPKVRAGGAGPTATGQLVSLPSRARRRARGKGAKLADEEEGLRDLEEADGENMVVWELGEASDDEGAPLSAHVVPTLRRGGAVNSSGDGHGERARMMTDHVPDLEDHRESTSSDATLTRPEAEAAGYANDEFGDWSQGKALR